MCLKNAGILQKEHKIYGNFLLDNFSYRLEILDYYIINLNCEIEEIKLELKKLRDDINE